MNYFNSCIQQFKDCPYSYHLKYNAGLRIIDEGESEHHLKFGKAMHEALKLIYKGSSLEAAKQALRFYYPRQLDETDKAKTLENGLQALEQYVIRWTEEDKKWEVIAVEEKDQFDYVDDPFTVILDLIVEHKEQGGIYGVDHKIVGKGKAYLDERFWQHFEPNSQLTKYYSYIKDKYGECSGFYINALGFGHRSRKYKGEPEGPWVRFGRQMFNRAIEQLKVEEGDTGWWIKQIEASEKENNWGMNTSGCGYCEFRPICAAGWRWPEDKELIMINYRKFE